MFGGADFAGDLGVELERLPLGMLVSALFTLQRGMD